MSYGNVGWGSHCGSLYSLRSPSSGPVLVLVLILDMRRDVLHDEMVNVQVNGSILTKLVVNWYYSDNGQFTRIILDYKLAR